MELIIAFLIGFCSYWFLTKENFIDKVPQQICPSKEIINKMAIECGKDSKKLKKELADFSLLKIQEGHYEYEDVLQTLMKK